MSGKLDPNQNLAMLINTIVLYRGGRLKIDELLQDLKKNPDVQIANIKALLKFLENFPRIFVINKDRAKGRLISVVRVITNIKLCPEHCKKQGSCHSVQGECGGLHMCKYFILSGMCDFQPNCQYGHDCLSRHNTEVLMSHCIDPRSIRIDDIRYLLCQIECRNPTTMPNTCMPYNTAKTCTNNTCKHLHMCRPFLEERCKFKSGCRRNHSIYEPSVREILKKYGFDMHRDEREILDELCHYFKNKSANKSQPIGPPGMPQRSISMSNLSSFTEETPNQWGRSSDRRQPRYPEQNRMMSARRPSFEDGSQYVAGMPHRPQIRQPSAKRTPVMQEPSQQLASTTGGPLEAKLSSVKTNGQAASESGSTSRLNICIHHLRGKCFYGNNCRRHHKLMIYQWQWKNQTDADWTDFEEEDNLNLEKCFCQVETTECYLKMGTYVVKVDFESMRASGGNFDSVQRLTTISSVNAAASIAKWTTVWHWYWLNDDKKWKEFGETSPGGLKSEIDSDKVEEKYLENPAGSIIYENGRHKYILLFTKMHQTNQKTGKKRDVLRRPTFFKSSDIAKRESKPVSSDNSMCEIPEEWIMSGDDIIKHYKVTELLKTSREFLLIDALFHQTMPPQKTITKLERIENGELWFNFCIKKGLMKRILQKDVDERQLFHGTKNDNIEAICHQGFDFRFCGKTVGTLHGKGSYFSTRAYYSDSYASITPDNSRKMFVAKVLVGDFTKSNKSYVRPPLKDQSEPHGHLYDSCVDDMTDPVIFVIFEISQVQGLLYRPEVGCICPRQCRGPIQPAEGLYNCPQKEKLIIVLNQNLTKNLIYF